MNHLKLFLRWILWLGIGLIGLVGCAHNPPPLVIDPAAVIQKNYDYSHPADIDRQSKPVWILPMMSQGWVPARIDPQTGDWIGGHYQSTIIQEGHWATLEEADQSGRPYIRGGEGQPIIPPLSTPGSSQGGAELDLAHIESRIAELEKKNSSQNSPPPLSESIVLSHQTPGTIQTMEVGNQKKLTVRYREEDEVEIFYNGKKYLKKLPHPHALLKITVPSKNE